MGVRLGWFNSVVGGFFGVVFVRCYIGGRSLFCGCCFFRCIGFFFGEEFYNGSGFERRSV